MIPAKVLTPIPGLEIGPRSPTYWGGEPWPLDEPCDCEGAGYPIPGILWYPDHPCAEPEIQVVEACNSCDRCIDHPSGLSGDEVAARLVAARFGLEAVFLEDRDWDAGLDEDDLGKGYGAFGVRNPAAPPFVSDTEAVAAVATPSRRCDHQVDSNQCDPITAPDSILAAKVYCKKCGLDGTIVIEASDVDWHDMTEDEV